MSLRTSLRRRLGGGSPDGPRPGPGRVAEPGADRVWPYWLERRLDPQSPADVPRDATPEPVAPADADVAAGVNVTARNWTTIGNLDSPLVATVDPRGLVTPAPGGWSLDWWVGADDRWHLPSREAGVRQRLVEAAPVVETAMRVPSGDAVAQAYGVRRGSGEGGGEVVMVEFANRSPVPVALALAVRPYGPESLAHVGRIEVDGTVVSVDGRPALLLSRLPARYATAGGGDGPDDVATTVLAGEAATHWPGTVTSPDGDAQAAFVFPLAHGATLQVALPLAPADEAPAREYPSAVPGPEHVARGWRSQSERGMRLELPDTRLAEAVAANRRYLLLRHDDPVVTSSGAPASGGRSWVREVAAVATALDAYGYHDEAVRALAPLPDRQRPDGGFPDEPDERAAVGAALWALGEHWRLAREPAVAKLAAETVVAGAHRLERTRRAAGPDDAAWVAAGLRAAAELLAGAGEPAAAEAVGEVAAEAAEGLVPALLGAPAGAGVPAGGATGADGRAVVADGGLRVDRTLALAAAELRSGDERAVARLAWALDAATTTWSWPTVLDERHGGGVAGDGHDLATAAALLTLVRDLLVRDDGDGGLALSSVVPEAWLGQGWEMHDAPTSAGRLSYAVRWHGERPAILWDLDRHPDAGPVRLTIPGLDPTWSTTEPSGDALLAPVPGDYLVRPGSPAEPPAEAAPAADPAAPTAPAPEAPEPPAPPLAPPAPLDPGSLS